MYTSTDELPPASAESIFMYFTPIRYCVGSLQMPFIASATTRILSAVFSAMIRRASLLPFAISFMLSLSPVAMAFVAWHSPSATHHIISLHPPSRRICSA